VHRAESFLAFANRREARWRIAFVWWQKQELGEKSDNFRPIEAAIFQVSCQAVKAHGRRSSCSKSRNRAKYSAAGCSSVL
jgi:hypothetical protein